MKGINKKEYLSKLLRPWDYVHGGEGDTLLNAIAKVFSVPESEIDDRLFLTGNGRTAQYLFLKSLELPKGSNVVIQGYTCNAAVGPIFWAGLTPKYVDIDPDNYSLSLESLKSVVDENTKVIIVQHTYGIPGPVDEVMEFAKARGILVFEDTAHALGMRSSDGSVLGTKADATLISFGIDKVLNTRVGGALLVNNAELIGPVIEVYKDVKVMGFFDTLMWLSNPLVWFVIAKFKGMRKKVARALTQIGILNMGFYNCEFHPEMPKQYPRRLSNVLSWFANKELADLDKNLEHRKRVVEMYYKELKARQIKGLKFSRWGRTMVKYLIDMPESTSRSNLYARLLGKGYLVSMWYDPVIFPVRNNKGLGYVGYTEGSCPNSEKISKTILALPTGMNIEESEVKDIVNTIESVLVAE